MVEVMLNRLAEISFKIFDVYKELVDLDSNKKDDPNYKNLRKVIIDKIATLRSDEEEIYDELRKDPGLAASCLFYFNQRRGDAQRVNNSLHVIDLDKDYTVVQERIQSTLEILCIQEGIVTTYINNPFIDYLCSEMKDLDRKEVINIFVLLQKRFTTNLTLKSFKFSDDFFKDVDDKKLITNTVNRKHIRSFADRDVEKDRLKNGFDGYTMRLREEVKNEYGIDEEIMTLLHEFIALQFIKESLPILFKSRIDNSSVSILLDIQSALLYLDDDSLKTIYLAALLWKPEDELTKNTLLEAIKLTEDKKKLFNSDLDTTKDF